MLEKIYDDIRKKICIYLYNFDYPTIKPLMEFSYAEMKEKENKAYMRYREDALFHKKVDCLSNEIITIIEPITSRST